MIARRLRSFYGVTYLFNHNVLHNHTNVKHIYENFAKISTTIGTDANSKLKLKRLWMRIFLEQFLNCVIIVNITVSSRQRLRSSMAKRLPRTFAVNCGIRSRNG